MNFRLHQTEGLRLLAHLTGPMDAGPRAFMCAGPRRWKKCWRSLVQSMRPTPPEVEQRSSAAEPRPGAAEAYANRAWGGYVQHVVHPTRGKGAEDHQAMAMLWPWRAMAQCLYKTLKLEGCFHLRYTLHSGHLSFLWQGKKVPSISGTCIGPGTGEKPTLIFQ